MSELCPTLVQHLRHWEKNFIFHGPTLVEDHIHKGAHLVDWWNSGVEMERKLSCGAFSGVLAGSQLWVGLTEWAPCVQSLLTNHKKPQTFLAIMLIFISHLYNAGHLSYCFLPGGSVLPTVNVSDLCSLCWGNVEVCITFSIFCLFSPRLPHLSLLLSTGCPNQTHFKQNLLRSYVVKKNESPWRHPFPPHCLCFGQKRGDGWRELALQAHLLQLWKRSIAPSLTSLHSSLCVPFCQQTLPLFFSPRLSPWHARLMLSACLLYSRCMRRELPRHTCFKYCLWCASLIELCKPPVYCNPLPIFHSFLIISICSNKIVLSRKDLWIWQGTQAVWRSVKFFKHTPRLAKLIWKRK